MHKLIVVDNAQDEFVNAFPNTVITFETYLKEYPKKNQSKVHVINLCDTDKYLSEGYYCSLLAEARNHFVIPSTNTINSMRGLVEVTLKSPLMLESEKKWLDQQPQDFLLNMLVGESNEPALTRFTKKLFTMYPAPLLKLTRGNTLNTLRVERINLSDLPKDEQVAFLDRLLEENIASPSRRLSPKQYRWDMAILVNPKEEKPASNQGAIERFVRAASKLGINAEVLSADDLYDLKKYDALFIRETTAIDHHTYRLACEAEKLGLAMVDDSVSILRCCNKVFLHDAFLYNNVPSLKTKIISCYDEHPIAEIERLFEYPLVLKLPESSFSKGVYKINSREELTLHLNQIFEHSALALAQEYLYTPFDWRIGVLSGRAIYACRYYMVRNHWQIYNHASSKENSGASDCLPTFEVPRSVLSVALRACKMIGNGLYGVDIKVKNNRAYVIEVNDNPSIDHQVEDKYLGNELYMQIMTEFNTRMESRGKR